jgi:DNA polymerase V
MSSRMMNVLGTYSPDQEVYSIDECFLGMNGFSHYDLSGTRPAHAPQVLQWVGIPGVRRLRRDQDPGQARQPLRQEEPGRADGVCDLTRSHPQSAAGIFAALPVNEVWGVGRRLTEQLGARGITTVEQLRTADAETLRQAFSVVLERTVRELNGIACLDLEAVAPNKQQIMSSRSFGAYVYTLPELMEAVALYMAGRRRSCAARAPWPAWCRSISAPIRSRTTPRNTSAA